MATDFDSLNCLGPLVAQPDIAALCEFTERVWETYREHARRQGPVKPGSRDYLIIRMLYIAEVTINAIRLTSTWKLTAAAMSLLRDRYEQTVRFSWLVRNPDQSEYQKYERAMFAKINAIAGRLDAETIKRFEERAGHPIAPWAVEKLSKEQRAHLGAWNATKLRDMVEKRDAFPPISNTHVAKEKLAPLYDEIYTQFSSVSHYDRFSIEMVRPEENDTGTIALSMLPHWPAFLMLRAAWFDVIQCFEVTQACFGENTSIQYESLLMEWYAVAKRVTDAHGGALETST